jgi:hypothetical protein
MVGPQRRQKCAEAVLGARIYQSMIDPNLTVDSLVQNVEEWLARDLPGWATCTRFHARRVVGDRILVATVQLDGEDVGCAVFDQQMSHLYYVETRQDRRRRGVADELWV